MQNSHTRILLSNWPRKHKSHTSTLRYATARRPTQRKEEIQPALQSHWHLLVLCPMLWKILQRSQAKGCGLLRCYILVKVHLHMLSVQVPPEWKVYTSTTAAVRTHAHHQEKFSHDSMWPPLHRSFRDSAQLNPILRLGRWHQICLK